MMFDEPRDSGSKNPGLPGACPGKHQHRSLKMEDRLALGWVQTSERLGFGCGRDVGCFGHQMKISGEMICLNLGGSLKTTSLRLAAVSSRGASEVAIPQMLEAGG